MRWFLHRICNNTKGWRMSHEHDFVKDLDGHVICSICKATADTQELGDTGCNCCTDPDCCTCYCDDLEGETK